MKIKFLLLYLIISLLVPVNVSPQENDPGSVFLLVRASQWDYTIYDINKMNVRYNQLINSMFDLSDEHAFESNEIHIDKKCTVNIILISRDIQHSLFISDVEFSLISEMPLPGEEYSSPVFDSFTAPNRDTILEGVPQFNVGIGTGDMKIVFVVGNTLLTSSSTRYIVWIAGLLSAMITIVVARKIYFQTKTISCTENILYPSVQI